MDRMMVKSDHSKSGKRDRSSLFQQFMSCTMMTAIRAWFDAAMRPKLFTAHGTDTLVAWCRIRYTTKIDLDV